MSSKSRSRSRSRSASRSPRRYRRNARDDSMSPIRTASGANLRTPKNYNSGGQGYGYRNYQNNNRGGFYNDRGGGFYNDRGFHNQRYNNYGRWNRGRGNFRGGWQDRNQWNHRSRYNSRSDRSRSRSRSKSYDRRDRSHSSSDSRSRSRSLSRDRDRRRRNRSAKGDERRRDRSKSKSKSKTPAKSVDKSKEEVSKMTPKKEEAPAITVEVPSTEPEAEGEKRNDPKTHFAETPAFTRSRWESPNASADEKQKQSVEMDIEQDEIFDQWDDDKLRAYLLKSKGKKLGKDAKKLLEVAETDAPSEVPVKQRKKKRSKSNADSPTKESRGRKKKRAKQTRSTSESSSSSSSWSPIHKAPEPCAKAKEEPEAPMPSERHTQQKQEYSQAPSNVYSHLQTYSASNERTQAVQYPFSHIQKSTPPVPALAEPTPPPPPVPVAQYPTPVPPPQPPLPAMPPAFGEIQVLGPDGTPMRLVPTSVPGPDGKMIQVMQVVQPSPAPIMPQASVPPSAPVSQPKQTYRIPPPPPSYPPPPTTMGKYPVPPSVTTSTANPSEIYKPEGFMEDLPSYEEISGYPNAQTSVPASVKEVPVVEKEPYQPSNHTSGLKKMEMMEKQKRRQEVLKTRFTPRPAGSWAQEVKPEKVEVKGESKNDKKTGSNQEQRGRAIPSLADPANRTKRPTHEDFVPNFAPDANEIGMMSGRQGQKTKADQRETDPPRIQDGVQHSTVQNVQGAFPDANTQHATAYPVTTSFVAQGFKAVQGNPPIFMGPNGEMLQMISPNQPPAPQPIPPAAYHASVQKPPDTILNKNVAQHDQRGVRETSASGLLHKKQKADSRKEVSTDEEDLGASARQRTISTGSEKKSKKKLKSASTEDSAEEDEPVKRKKEKKRKKKNKKKKDQADDETHVKEKKKKKEKRQKEKSELISLEHETIASKKDLKAFEEVKKKSKDDHLNRSVDDDLPLSHIRAIVPRKKREATEPLLRYVEDTAKQNLATSTSYEDRFVSLFGSGEVDSPSTDPEERIDITKKSVRKFKINVKGTRDVAHMTEISLSERIKHFDESGEEEKESQKVQISLNVSGFSKTSRSSRSQSKSRSRSRSSSASSDSRRKSKKKKKKKRRSRSSSRSQSRSKSRSVSLPKAYSSMDDKSGRRGRSGSRAKDYSDDDLRHDLEKRKAAKDRSGSRSRSRSRSDSSDEGRNRNRGRQMYHNNNNQGYHFNNRGRGRGYFQNFRGRGWYNNNNRGNFRGRWNWNNQGWNNRNQGYPYQRYDNRDNNRDHRYRGRSRDRSRSRSRSRDDRSSSHERDARRNGKHRDEKSPKKDEKPMEQEQKQSGGQGQPSTQASDGNGKPARKPSPAQWGHDMFEEHETEDKKEPAT